MKKIIVLFLLFLSQMVLSNIELDYIDDYNNIIYLYDSSNNTYIIYDISGSTYEDLSILNNEEVENYENLVKRDFGGTEGGG